VYASTKKTHNQGQGPAKKTSSRKASGTRGGGGGSASRHDAGRVIDNSYKEQGNAPSRRSILSLYGQGKGIPEMLEEKSKGWRKISGLTFLTRARGEQLGVRKSLNLLKTRNRNF